VKIKDNFVVWCHTYLPVSKWVTQQSYSASRGKAYMAACMVLIHCYMRNRMHSPNIKMYNEIGCKVTLTLTDSDSDMSA
jgi:hypothetical protein